jgi:restriction system protein
MARRKTSPFEELVEVVAMLPWWAGVALAAVSYVWLHGVASAEVAAVTQPGQIGQVVGQQLSKTFATFGQYVLPAACLIGAALSAWERYRRRRLLAQVTENRSAADALEGISWREFEMLVGEAFRQKGFAVTETGGGGADGGVDLVLARDGEKFLVQCKQWKAFKVGVSVVRELYGVMAARCAAGGYVVTSGQFTQEAKDFASGRNIFLMDGPALRSLIGSVKAAGVRRIGEGNAELRPIPVPTSIAEPACPVCGNAMVRRTAKRGANAGNSFWGCPKYPACRGIREI